MTPPQAADTGPFTDIDTAVAEMVDAARQQLAKGIHSDTVKLILHKALQDHLTRDDTDTALATTLIHIAEQHPTNPPTNHTWEDLDPQLKQALTAGNETARLYINMWGPINPAHRRNYRWVISPTTAAQLIAEGWHPEDGEKPPPPKHGDLNHHLFGAPVRIDNNATNPMLELRPTHAQH